MSALDNFKHQLQEALWSSAGGGVFLTTTENAFTVNTVLQLFASEYEELYIWQRWIGLQNYHTKEIFKETGDFAQAINTVSKLDPKIKRLAIFGDATHQILPLNDKRTPWIHKTLQRIHTGEPTQPTTNIIFVGETFNLPVTYKEYFQNINVPLPDITEITTILENTLDAYNNTHPAAIYPAEQLRTALINAAIGLTRLETETAFNHIRYDGKITNEDINLVTKIKTNKHTDKAIEHITTNINIDDIGGLEALKTWLIKREQLKHLNPETTNIPQPKGILLAGLPGTGKSLTAKVAANIFNYPLIKLDMGAVFGKYYGESIQGLHAALTAIEANAPCILWIDEIEKALTISKETGASTREEVLGSFLTWMQERTHNIFIVATANDATTLRPELLRKGRFDEIFFLDLPTPEERKAILTVHLKKRIPQYNTDLTPLINALEGYVGAEIEQILIDALIEAHYQNIEPTEQIILNEIHKTAPLSQIRKPEIEQARRWAREARIANASKDNTTPHKTGFNPQ